MRNIKININTNIKIILTVLLMTAFILPLTPCGQASAQTYDVVPSIRAALDAGEKLLAASRLSDSRAKLVTARNLINEAREDIPHKDGIVLALRCAKLIHALDTREDALVQNAIEVLDSEGPDAASAFLQEVLQKAYSISNESAVFVSLAITNSMPLSALEQEVEEKNNAANIYAPKIELTDKDLKRFENMQNVARFRAQERADSARAASAAAMKIYKMLEAGKINDANEEFVRQEEFLTGALSASAFNMLSTSVSHAVSMPVLTARDIKRMEQEEKKRTARQAKIDAKNAKAQAKQERKEQTRLAKQERKAEPETEAPLVISELGANQRMALYISAKIYAVVERGDAEEAQTRFEQYRTPLQRYLHPEDFQNLETTVAQSYNHVTRQ